MNTLPDAVIDVILQCLAAQTASANALLVGRAVDCDQLEWRGAFLAVDDCPLAALESMPRFNLAVVVDAPAHHGLNEVRALLGRLRDVKAQSVIAVFARQPRHSPLEQPVEAAWREGDFIALGFRRVARPRTTDDPLLVYSYDIHDYKITPDWLNARHWANPGRWDDERW